MTHPFASEHYQKMALEARQLVRQWVNESQSIKPTFAAEQLAGVLKDPNGLPFTVGFVDGVIRPEDDNVSGRNLSPYFRPGTFLPALVHEVRCWLRWQAGWQGRMAHRSRCTPRAARDGRSPDCRRFRGEAGRRNRRADQDR